MKRRISNLIFSFLILGCSNVVFYSSDQVHIKKIETTKNEKRIIYSIPIETLYYSSGCNAKFSSDSTKVELKFIRQRVGLKYYGNIESQLIEDSQKHINYLIKLPIQVKEITIIEPRIVILLQH